MSGTREDKAHKSKKRPARVPMSAGNKLHIPEHLKEDGYFYYWAIDRKGAIEQMEAAWYERVKDDRGEDLTVPAGKGETHYAMKIKQEYYDEDIGWELEIVRWRPIDVQYEGGFFYPLKILAQS